MECPLVVDYAVAPPVEDELVLKTHIFKQHCRIKGGAEADL
jgi:hypothetical protein